MGPGTPISPTLTATGSRCGAPHRRRTSRVRRLQQCASKQSDIPSGLDRRWAASPPPVRYLEGSSQPFPQGPQAPARDRIAFAVAGTNHPSSDKSRPAVETRRLTRVYKTRRDVTTALENVDLRVGQGELFGVLGPNGAGKTTLIKILVTLLLPTSGEAFVDGLDVVRQFRELRHRIAMVSGGENVGFGMLTVREQLWMFSQFYCMPSQSARRHIDELLERLGLSEAADRRVSALSSGMRQKMNLIRGLITNPRILFLDEPTVALDVGAARDVRDEVRRWMAEDPSRTVILTTHYMMEADELCDRVAIVNRGRIVAQGTPAELKQQVQQDAIVDLQL